MCSQYQMKLPLHVVEQAFSHTRFPLRFPLGRPNFEPADRITIGDVAPVVTGVEGPELGQVRFGWKGPSGRPVFNFRSEGRRFDGAVRCLVPASGFYEFTDPQPGQKRKTQWLFTLTGRDWFWMAGVVRDGGFALLTTEPGPDVAPFHGRQVVVLPPDLGAEWLDLTRSESDLLRALPEGSLAARRTFPPTGP
jgi:putative SOS response-associated peptidase YedK